MSQTTLPEAPGPGWLGVLQAAASMSKPAAATDISRAFIASPRLVHSHSMKVRQRLIKARQWLGEVF
ncbi:hypothetical protein [Cupriavidus consociatus]|uniref:hypothetical protein n=1 Tax=Cupriavidus consociatus TaxID=2821357 RepID=UPI001AEA3E8A|nr:MULTISPECIES: hypothetical protein [unclassified Cupriavidus]MBP0620659.1 hypothetical protein [Cupriavidus sp. LEh25]MDK2657319.1 hypothetical protein [Cupriavidus sp. LEh21]